MPRSPHYFITHNLVLRTPTEAWAVYKLAGQSYPGLSHAGKIEAGERLEAFAYAIEADFQIDRVSLTVDPALYIGCALATLDPRHGDREGFLDHIERHRDEFERRRVTRPATYLSVRLTRADRAGWLSGAVEQVSASWTAAAQRIGFEEAPGITDLQLEALHDAERRAFDRITAYLDAERVGTGAIANLIRRAYTRGLGEPPGSQDLRPQALTFLDPDGHRRFQPYTHYLLKLHESRVTIEARSLRVEGEVGASYQALLAMGGMPEEAAVPSSAAELMFTPLDLDFPADAHLAVEYVPNKEARRTVNRRKVEADQIAIEESHGVHGPSSDSAERPVQARELESVLAGGDRPPLLRSALTLAVGAPSEQELEERVEALRRSYGRTELHRPYGDQHRLFLSTLPAVPFPLPEYKQHLLPDQLGAMVPHATSQAGSEIGPCIGHTLTGSRQPIQFDLAEACQQNRPPTCLLTGSLGSGKTIALELLLWQALLQGSGPIVDIDPKGDHALHKLPGVAERMEQIELSPDDRYRGLLDPMRIATDEQREDLTYNFLLSILPAPVKPEWQTQTRLAIQAAVAAGERTCTHVLHRMSSAESPAAREAAAALGVHASAGLARLGLGAPDDTPPGVGAAQVVSFRIRNLNLPLAGTARSDLLEEERISLAVLRLLAAYALRLTSTDTRRHSVLAMDEAWALTADTQGRALLERISRTGRSQNITPILATQMLGDAEALEPLVGALFAFGVETQAEAEKALALLRLDVDDAATTQRLTSFRRGRCLFRDYEGRVAAMRVDPGTELLEALDTTPHRKTEPPQVSQPTPSPSSSSR